jgi:glycosyltransferase involved in cell wall biosynthesis
MKKIASFNNEKTLLAITSFPNPKDGQRGSKEFNAVGWHSQKTLRQLEKHAPVVIFAEQRDGRSVRQISDRLLLNRIWKKGNPLSFITMAKTILGLNKIKHIFVQFEFNVFGGIIPNLTLLLMLAFLRLMGRTVTFELHQVITDISLLKKHINITSPLLQRFFNLSLGIFYRVVGLVANDIIVFEQELKTRLAAFVPEEKIHVLSLAVEPKVIVPQTKARKLTKLSQNEFIVLVFGFINGYKGIDWIINSLKGYTNKNVRLVIAGGENPYLKDEAHYQRFYQSIVDEAQKHAHITLTGFIPDDEIQNYFGAADLVVMPYEVFMAASGPFSLALSYGKPIILSNILSDYAKSPDFAEALKKANLKRSDIFFPLRSHNLTSLIEKAKYSPIFLKQLTTFAKTLGHLRSTEVVTERLYSLMTSTPLSSLTKEQSALSLS